MAADLNSVCLVGNLVRDAELKTVIDFSVMNFSIAVNESIKKDGKWETYANFFDCFILGKRADSLAPYMKKGTKVAVQATARQDRWEKDGQKFSKIVFRCNDIELVGGNKASGGNAPAPASEGNADFPQDIPF